MEKIGREELVVALVGALTPKFFGDASALADEVTLVASAIERRSDRMEVESHLRLVLWTIERLQVLAEVGDMPAATRLGISVAKHLLEASTTTSIATGPGFDAMVQLFAEKQSEGTPFSRETLRLVIGFYEQIARSLREYAERF